VLARTGQDDLAMPDLVSAPMLRKLGGSLFGMQVGHAAGELSREVFGATDIGLPLVREPAIVLLPTNVAAFSEGLEIPADEVRLFLALREAAHARLFTHVTWLRGHLMGAVEAYARGIEIDPDAIEDAVRQLDPNNPDELRQALAQGVFAPRTTEAQRATLERLETSLALVEGWVDEITATAAAPHLPNIAPLREMLRRRRAAGGPAEHTFATLVGLELRPRRSRDAAALWAQIERTDGVQAREAVWAHPDLMPTAEDLDDPAGYAGRLSATAAEHAEVDRALAEILGAEPGPDRPGMPDEPDEPAGPAPDVV
jgi:putative hydrolase